ncbi:hypothetical protein D9613_008872 [Agrocybe pediades]|uniref:Uncharacterized protein n=1 Tax=Agrocybe pediades TaxID=84607 RepID=A0A8H4VNS7_9AGAR|nr:hypothetical protein D9613_008872 [Agrocybe pediades]
MSKPIIVDDRNSSIRYSGFWGQAGSSSEYDHTTSFTVKAGSSAIFHFSDVTNLGVYATIPKRTTVDTIPAQISFQIDEQEPAVFSANMTDTTQHRRHIFEATASNFSASGSHILNITSLQDGGLFYLDYINLTLANSNGADPVSTELPITITTDTVISTTVSGSADRYMVTTTSSSSQTGPSSKLAIAGGVLGAVALVTVIVGFAWWMIAKKRRQYKTEKFRSESRQRLFYSPWKTRQSVFKDPIHVEYGQPMSTTNPTMFQNSFPKGEKPGIILEPVRA